MKLFGSNSILMVGLALIFVGASTIFGPSMVQQTGGTPAAAAPGVILGLGMPKSAGYTDSLISSMQKRAKDNPSDYAALSGLGIAYLQKARETNDPTFYAQAEAVLKKALDTKPDDYDALSALGSLNLSRHDFRQAQDIGVRAQQTAPQKPYAYGVVGDAQIELGNYEDAVASFQKMIDLRPDLSSYSRVSYARELYGDVPGAIEAMQSAVRAGGPVAENTAWCRVYLAHLYFNSNQLDRAEQLYNEALAGYPDYLHALAGLGRVRWAQGRTNEAIDLYKRSVAIVPFPEYLLALGDLYTSTGNTAQAKEQYDLVQYIYHVFETNSVNVDVEKAAFLAEYDIDIPQAVKLAERAAAGRKDIHTDDTFAWVLYKSGRHNEAAEMEKQAMRLGTQDPMLYYHNGMIQLRLGDNDGARKSLKEAFDINPHFSIRHAGEVADMLKKLGN